MRLEYVRVVLTGAGGGIGADLARLLAKRGAKLLLVGRGAEGLQKLQRELADSGVLVKSLAADIRQQSDRQRIVEEAERAFGGVDMLINNAGVLDFNAFAEADPFVVEQLLMTNLVAPILLTRACLPGMLERHNGRIVNIGSAFGSLGFPGFAVYSASKFGLRGFSEALRRELGGSGVGVTYVAPRAVRTALNPEAVTQLAQATGMNVDEPAWVAQRIVEAIEMDRTSVSLGMSERFFAKVNALLPTVVDNALVKRASTVLEFARKGRAKKLAEPDRQYQRRFG